MKEKINNANKLYKKRKYIYKKIQTRLTQGKEFLDNIHRGYVFTSPIYSNEKDKLIAEYNNGNPNNLSFNELQNQLKEYDRRVQEDYIFLLAYGKPAWEKSKPIKRSIDEFVNFEMIRDYENGRYKNIELSDFTKTSILNPYSRSGKENVMDINVYLDTLRKGVDMIW